VPGPLSGIRVMELPAIGPVPFLGMLMAGPAPRFSATPGETAKLTPVLADTEALLREAGYAAAEIGHLRNSGTIG
jgi:crotonobetainyl-CoA:carnitine CoA-transferase CaiB-like acyl-CoA transferase